MKFQRLFPLFLLIIMLTGCPAIFEPLPTQDPTSPPTAYPTAEPTPYPTSLPADDGNDDFSEAVYLTTEGTEYSTDLGFTGDEDYFYFDGNEGYTYTIETFSSIDNTDTFMYLYDSSYTVLAENDDKSLQSSINFPCTTTDIYYVMIRGYLGTALGDYSISVIEYTGTPLPTSEPTDTPVPTTVPTTAPTSEPTTAPTAAPTTAPTAVPTTVPTATPTGVPATNTIMITEVGACIYINISGWFEVHNYGASSIDIGGWEVKSTGYLTYDPWTYYSSKKFTLPSLVIPAGGYALIRGKNSTHLKDGTQVIHVIDGSNVAPNWSGSGSFIELLSGGQTVDFVRFGTSSVAPTSAGEWTSGSAPALPYSDTSKYGYSIARNVSNTDTNSPSDWTLRAFSTQGGPNDVTSDTDADMDGIPDCSEGSGTTFAGLPLYTWGARTGQRDIFIHINYMNSADPGINPRREALDMMKQSFLNNPTGPIYVHFDVGNLFDAVGGIDPADYDLSDTNHQVPYAQAISYNPPNGNYASFYDYKYTYMEMARKQVFHYILFANSQNENGSGGSSGVAEYPGNDVIVSIGSWGLSTSTQNEVNRLINYQAGTLMHEFGHNLGLGHGGGENLNYKPNYVSIMNYMYQLYGLPVIGTKEGDRYYWKEYANDSWGAPFNYYFPTGSLADLTDGPYTTNFHLDYSNGSSLDLNESNLTESQGLRRSGSTGVDWNGDHDTGDPGISRDINNRDTAYGVLSDYNDWANINLFFIRNWGGEEEGIGPDRSTRVLILPATGGDEGEPIHIETLYPPEEPGI